MIKIIIALVFSLVLITYGKIDNRSSSSEAGSSNITITSEKCGHGSPPECSTVTVEQQQDCAGEPSCLQTLAGGAFKAGLTQAGLTEADRSGCAMCSFSDSRVNSIKGAMVSRPAAGAPVVKDGVEKTK